MSVKDKTGIPRSTVFLKGISPGMFENCTHNICIVTGHFGAGKTNFAVNLALREKLSGREVTLVDLDIVNPYFRAADNRAELEAAGVRCILPEFANTNVDIPTLPPEIYSALEVYEKPTDRLTIFDVGGDNGAVALGMYRRFFEEYGYDMLCCVNCYRPLTATASDALESLREIEDCSRMKITGIVNTSNLGDETAPEDILDSLSYADELSELAKVPVVCTAVMSETAEKLSGVKNIYPIRQITKRMY